MAKIIYLNKLPFVEYIHFQNSSIREITVSSKALQVNVNVMDCILLTVMKENNF